MKQMSVDIVSDMVIDNQGVRTGDDWRSFEFGWDCRKKGRQV